MFTGYRGVADVPTPCALTVSIQHTPSIRVTVKRTIRIAAQETKSDRTCVTDNRVNVTGRCGRPTTQTDVPGRNKTVSNQLRLDLRDRRELETRGLRRMPLSQATIAGHRHSRT